MVGSAPTEDANLDDGINVKGMERDLRGGKGIYSSIGLIIGTVGCFCSALYCCIRIARKEAVLRNGIRIPGIKLSEDQRRAILEFLFPGNKSLNIREKEKECHGNKTFHGSPATPRTIIESTESDKKLLMDSFVDILQRTNNSEQPLFPLPRLSDFQEGNFVIDLDPIEQPLYEDQEDVNFDANFLCCSICLENYDEGDDIVYSRRCSHYFHKECIMPWLLKETSHLRCPSCRQHMVDIYDLREAASKVVGTHGVIIDDMVEVLEAETSNSLISISPLRNSNRVHVDESPI